jgi:hypothetical protein
VAHNRIENIQPPPITHSFPQDIKTTYLDQDIKAPAHEINYTKKDPARQYLHNVKPS